MIRKDYNADIIIVPIPISRMLKSITIYNKHTINSQTAAALLLN